jgi:hypothetical protein
MIRTFFFAGLALAMSVLTAAVAHKFILDVVSAVAGIGGAR